MSVKSSVSKTLARRQKNTQQKIIAQTERLSVRISQTTKYTSDDPHSACSLMRCIRQSKWIVR